MRCAGARFYHPSDERPRRVLPYPIASQVRHRQPAGPRARLRALRRQLAPGVGLPRRLPRIRGPRPSVNARAGGSDAKAPLCLTGHLDVVPVGARAWAHDPFSGETDGDRLYGRGASDMKAGVAAILLAARSMAKRLAGTPGVVIVLTAAEEGGCIGAASSLGHQNIS